MRSISERTLIQQLMYAADILGVEKAPFLIYKNEEGTFSGHWTGTKDLMVAHLGRPLTEAEVTCLSLSRAFGPCPLLSDEQKNRLFSFLFPGGNENGDVLTWLALGDQLAEYCGFEEEKEAA